MRARPGDGRQSRRRRGGGKEGRRALRQADEGRPPRRTSAAPCPPFQVLDEEGVSLIEANADLILEEIGIEFRDDEEALRMWADAGADVSGRARALSAAACAARW